jgi:23S rRNA pseudouridine2605 synthase
MLREGRVTINGKVAILGDQADLGVDAVKVDGKRLKAPRALRYILLHKPVGVVTTTEDPEGRTTVVDLLHGRVSERVFPVGRLDYGSEGLVILTNDGELAQRVAHPSFGVMREYQAKVKGVPDQADVRHLAEGTFIEGQRVVPHEVAHLKTTPSGMNSWWKVVVGEGKTHEVREMFARIGHPVQRLVRVAIGAVRDPRLRPGAWRELSEDEIEMLRRGQARGRRPENARSTSAGLHAQSRHLRAGEADRGGRARAGDRGHRQARVERKPSGVVTEGAGSDQKGAGDPQSLPGRRRVRAAPHPRPAPRR